MNKKEIKTYAIAAIIIALICVVYKMYFAQEGMTRNMKSVDNQLLGDNLSYINEEFVQTHSGSPSRCNRGVVADYCSNTPAVVRVTDAQLKRIARVRKSATGRIEKEEDRCTAKRVKELGCI